MALKEIMMLICVYVTHGSSNVTFICIADTSCVCFLVLCVL